MKIKKLLNGINLKLDKEIKEVEISAISSDSRKIKKGSIFIALRGIDGNDGHKYINEAFEKGALFVVAEENKLQNPNIIKVDNTRLVISKIAANFYNHPSKKLNIIGIVGSNGKTSISYLIENIFQKAKKKIGIIGTVNCRYNGKVIENDYTTPEAIEIQKILSEMVKAEIKFVAMEVSSHAIALNRVGDIFFDVGVFSNFSQDHLDFHKTMAEYWQCKKSFFTDFLQKNSTVVLNTYQEKGKELSKTLSEIKQIKIGDNLDVYANKLNFDINGITGDLNVFKDKIKFKTNCVGRYNIENMLCAVCVCINFDISKSAIKKGIEKNSVPGRLEKVYNKNFYIFIDYAHSPDALDNVLKDAC